MAQDKEIIICSCHSFHHQVMFYQIENELFVSIHLTTYKNIFKRIWYALKYICGYKSNYGAWDEFIFDDENKKQLINYLK